MAQPTTTGLLTQGQGPGWETWNLDTENKNIWVDALKEFMGIPSGRTTLPRVLEQSYVMFSGEFCAF